MTVALKQRCDRRDTLANWRAANPVLLAGEQVEETDTHKRRTGDGVTSYNSLGFPIVPRYTDVDGDPRRFALSQLVEGFFFKDDFSNDTSGQYTGTFTISGGNCTITAGNNLTLTKTSIQTYGKFSCVFKESTSVEGNSEVIYFYYDYPNSKFVGLSKEASSNKVYVKYRRPQDTSSQYSLVYTGGSAADACTYITTFHRLECDIRSDGTFKIYVDDILNLDSTWTTTPTFSGYRFSRGDIGTSIVIDELTYIPPVAFSDSYASDTEARYHQLASSDLSTWAAAAAGDVAVSGGALVLASDDDRGLCAAVRSYNFKSGEIECSFDNNNDGGGGADTCCLLFGFQDINNYYRLALEDDTAGAENLKLYKVVAGSATQLGATKDVSATYTRSNKTWIKVQWDSEKGRIWAWLRDNAGTYPTTPDISDAFSSAYSMGKVGYRATVTTAGAGNLNVAFDDLTIRCNCLVGETNVPATETGFYLRDEFSVDSIGRYNTTTGSIATIAVAGGKLTMTHASDGWGGKIVPVRLSVIVFEEDITINDATIGIVDNALSSDGGSSGSAVYNGYRVRVAHSAQNIKIYRVVAGSGSLVATSATKTITLGVTYHIKITYSSATGIINVYWDNSSTPDVTYTDTIFLTGMFPFVGSRCGATGTTHDNLTISGTRYYNKPMLRGAQLGEWWDGTKSVYGTRFVDDHCWDTTAEYTVPRGTLTADTANGYFSLIRDGSGYGDYYPTGLLFSTVTLISAEICLNNAELYTVNFPVGGYEFYIEVDATKVRLMSDSAGQIVSYTTTVSTTTWYSLVVDAGTSGTIKVWWNGVLIINTFGACTTALTYPKITVYGTTASDSILVRNLRITGVESLSKLGLNLTLGGVPHGARYDTQEAATFSFTNLAKYGKYFLIAAAKTTNASAEDAEFYFRNLTDTSNISLDATNTLDIALSATTPTDFTKELLLDSDDRGDTITLQARRKTAATDNSAAVFIEYASILPSMEVGAA